MDEIDHEAGEIGIVFNDKHGTVARFDEIAVVIHCKLMARHSMRQSFKKNFWFALFGSAATLSFAA